MSERRRLLLIASVLLAASSAAAGVDLSDTVATLELSRELDARGRLGGITVDRLGFLYVANFRDAVWRISPEGEVETLTRGLYGASGNAVDSRGDLYQANFLGNTVVRIRRTGEVETFAASGLNGPVGIAIDTDDRLYVCNCNGNYLSRIGRDGAAERLAESERFACPNGIVLGPDDHLYVTNFNHHDILRVSKTGEVSVFATVPGGAGNAHIAFSKGFFYVTKIIANRVVKLSTRGEVFPLAGSGQPGHADGPALEATFHRPNGIAVAPAGDLLYVNTLVGEASSQTRGSISVRTVQLTTLTKVLDAAMDAGGLEAMEAAYAEYRRDPVRGLENTVGEMITYGYRYLSDRQVAPALRIFELNAESHPEVAAAQFQLGEAYRYTGQTDAAAAQYRKTLELDPDHAQARARLEQLDG